MSTLLADKQASPQNEYKIRLLRPHAKQELFRRSKAKRKVIRAGRRGGKTTGSAIIAVDYFLAGKRVLYAAPTIDQVEAFWFEVCNALEEPIQAKLFNKNETEHSIEFPGTKQRIRAKTAWNADTLRGDYADLLILEEWQLSNEDAWEVVGAPMLLDNDGDAIFIYTPPSLRSTGTSKARDPRHAAKLYLKAQEDKSGRWETFHFTSYDNPHLNRVALNEITKDMSRDAFRHEIMAEDDDMELGRLVYGMFNERVCKIPRFEIPANWSHFSGHDFGIANPAALFVAQNPTGEFFVYKEYLPGPGKTAYHHVEAWKEITKGKTLLKRVGGSHQEEEIRQLYAAQGWSISEPYIPKVNAQIEKVQSFMEHNRIYVFDDCINYLNELFNCLFDVDENNVVINKIKDEARYHSCACARYLFSSFQTERIDNTMYKPVSYLRVK